MPFLLREIKHFNKHAAGVLEDAALRSDSEILTLTREDLRDLFPGPLDFKLRRTLFDMIHKQPIAVEILKKLKGFLRRDSLRAAPSDNGVLVDYRQYLKDTKTQMNHIQSFLDAQIDLLEEFSADQPDSGQTDGCSQEAGGEPFVILPAWDDVEPTVLYKMVVGGKTFGTHLKLMQEVEKPFQNRLRVCHAQQDNKITFVFCPISSRIGADVDAAMVDVKGDKPIILVLMHHTHKVRPVTSMKIRPDDDNVVLRVNVFYHETSGLLKCDENAAAVTEIQNKLWKDFPRINDSGGNSKGRGADRKGADGKGADGKGADGKGTDGKGADGNSDKWNPKNWGNRS